MGIMENGKEAPLLNTINPRSYMSSRKCITFYDESLYEERYGKFFEGGYDSCSFSLKRPFFCRKPQNTPVTIMEHTKQLADFNDANAQFIQSWIPFKEVMGAAFAEANRGEKIVSNVGNTVQKIGLKIFRRAAKFYCGFPKKLDGFSSFLDIDTDDTCAGLIARVDNMLTFSKDYFAKCEMDRATEKRTGKR